MNKSSETICQYSILNYFFKFIVCLSIVKFCAVPWVIYATVSQSNFCMAVNVTSLYESFCRTMVSIAILAYPVHKL